MAEHMSHHTLEQGKPLGRYVIARDLGETPGGSTYLASCPSGLRRVLKVVDAERRERLKAEYERLRPLRHPSLVQLFEWVEDSRRAYYAMEYVQGISLQSFTRAGAFMLPGVIALFQQVVEAIAFLHCEGVTHGELAPWNVVVRGGKRAMIVDFGLARPRRRSELGGAAAIGEVLDFASPEYAAFLLGITPAQEYLPTPRDDVYALGRILYQALTGCWPFPVDGLKPAEEVAVVGAMFERLPKDPQELNPHAPPLLSKLALRMLQPIPGDRPSDAAAVLQVLEEARKSDKIELASVAFVYESSEVLNEVGALEGPASRESVLEALNARERQHVSPAFNDDGEDELAEEEDEPSDIVTIWHASRGEPLKQVCAYCHDRRNEPHTVCYREECECICGEAGVSSEKRSATAIASPTSAAPLMPHAQRDSESAFEGPIVFRTPLYVHAVWAAATILLAGTVAMMNRPPRAQAPQLVRSQPQTDEVPVMQLDAILDGGLSLFTGALPLPEKPLSAQKRPPCAPWETAMRGACWQGGIVDAHTPEEIREECALNEFPDGEKRYELAPGDCLKTKRVFIAVWAKKPGQSAGRGK